VIKILVVDDSALVRKLFGKVLSGEPDFEVAFARDGLEALGQLHVFQPDVITLDIHMPQMDGLACLDRIMVERPCPVLMVSSLTAQGAETTLEAMRLGAVDFVPKPEGAVSLHMEVFAPQFIAKVRSAANAKLKASLRLRERVQHRIGGGTRPRERTSGGITRASDTRASGAGIVLVGTSTGGPPALESLLTPLPAKFPWPVVIAQHMPASFTGPLARRLDRICALEIAEVTKSTVLEPGCAYIGRGDGDIVVSRRGSAFVAAPVPAGDYPWHPSTDRLVRSALKHVSPEQLVGVLMTGMGDDGAQAMTQLHALGGRTIAEAEETAVVWGMPGELVKAGGADWVLPVQKIADKLLQLVPIHASDPKTV
jgi:two-component system, chemotaxis family, protein-glutamate methylesterase/glutaminase